MQAPPAPIIVRVVETNEISGLGDVLLQAVGLTGAIAIAALAFGLLFAAAVIGYRKLRVRFEPDEAEVQTQALGITPPAHR